MDGDMHETAAVLHAGIAFYLYFLATQREFAYREWKNQMMTRLQVKWKHLCSSAYVLEKNRPCANIVTFHNPVPHILLTDQWLAG